MELNAVILKSGKDKALRNHHHWIFSGAVHSLPEQMHDGDLLPVHSSCGEFLGVGYFNRKSAIIGRMITFDRTPLLDKIKERLKAALLLRSSLFNFNQTTGFRLINGEGDGLSGLVIDIYGQVAVIQISTLGMDKLKPLIIDFLIKQVNPSVIYEKSNLSVRKKEGLEEFQGFLYGDSTISEVNFFENGLKFQMELAKSQKNRFFS